MIFAASLHSLLFAVLVVGHNDGSIHEHNHDEFYSLTDSSWLIAEHDDNPPSFSLSSSNRRLSEEHRERKDGNTGPYTLITRQQTECELEALTAGSLLADRYNSLDENTEWDVRLHNDYLTEHLGFSGWITQGTWGSKGVTPHQQNAAMLYKRGGWAGARDLHSTKSGYAPLENQWLYMMGDSTQRQIWGSITSPLTSHEFEKNAKEWSRENCGRQYPHRKRHPEGHFFPDEGWSGKCGNNEVTCHMGGFGTKGKLTFDWKHFPYEDYDQWVFGPDGPWSNSSERIPDILVVQVGLHSCFHAFNTATGGVNQSFVDWHTGDLPRLMASIKTAVARPRPSHPEDNVAPANRTIVVISTAGRIGNPSAVLDKCTWTFNRVLAHEAHLAGFVVLEREEIERRLLFKSDMNPRMKFIKAGMHLAAPSPQIIATSLTALVGCLRR